MTLQAARQAARETARESGLPVVIVKHSPDYWPDEFDERDTDGCAYAYCANQASALLFGPGLRAGLSSVVETIQPGEVERNPYHAQWTADAQRLIDALAYFVKHARGKPCECVTFYRAEIADWAERPNCPADVAAKLRAALA